MAKGANQKLKCLYLAKILLENTDEENAMTMSDILAALAMNGIKAERKSIYDDLEALRVFGIDVVARKGKSYEYFIGKRDFQLAELKLLVDAVQSSKFITERKSEQLIKKVEQLASKKQAEQLQRQICIKNRVKTMNESIYYNVDKIHTAISNGCKICFKYFEWKVSFTGGEKLKKQLKRNGSNYIISPWELTWDDENYYLIGYDSLSKMIKHYRVDKMMSIELSPEKRDGQEHFNSFNLSDYQKKTFSMFGGKEEKVTMQFSNNMIGVVVDRFGKDIIISKCDENSFQLTVGVNVSPQFLGWIFALGDDVKILSPKSVVAQMKKQSKKVSKLYKDKEKK
ncbi:MULTISPECIES: YafY family protein [unclassified Ruminococcus]|uniref:helix-turn-helix transcriptional regulator n=1 Tax=unclassified Ruminococcus TaxID=2608920 RepID=UPI00210DAC8A|nr:MULTISPECIES: WYL domain-containing protein [unclassified Ruminococcus]MCQ4023045.1 WYL domain-containing protein [Ruminococcus sp. zg-924]MCQ4115482.1 WYL domain-containing protein [Ruminococcus sp. zg-921]